MKTYGDKLGFAGFTVLGICIAMWVLGRPVDPLLPVAGALNIVVGLILFVASPTPSDKEQTE